MPIIKSAKKRLKTSARQAEENRRHRDRARLSAKRVRDLAANKKVQEALAELATAQSLLDKAAKVNAIHPRAVARQKQALTVALKSGGNKEKTPGRKKPATGAKPAPKK